MATSTKARTWRAAFLPLKDPTVTSSSHLLASALRDVVSHSKALLSAAPDLPWQEVTGDIILLVDLASREGLFTEDGDWSNIVSCICHLILDLSCRSKLELKASSFITMVNFLQRIIDISYSETVWKVGCFQKNNTSYGCRSEMAVEALQVLMHITHENGGSMSLQDVKFTVDFLLHLVSCHNLKASNTSCTNTKTELAAKNCSQNQKMENENEVQTLAFVALGNIFVRAASAVSKDIWKATVETLRKVMDFTASKSQLEEDRAMSRYYAALLHCLQLVLADPKGYLAEHLPGFVAALRMFFTYGLTSNPPVHPFCNHIKSTYDPQLDSRTTKDGVMLKRGDSSAYRPPHLRSRTKSATHQIAMDKHVSASLQPEASGIRALSSDSELSDSDGSLREGDRFKSSKARTAAILCIQALCRADPKSLHAQWAMLLPTNDVLHPRRYQATLMTCLLFDPVLKTRMAAATTLATMLEDPSSAFLQVAEYKESTKAGSFTTLSSSLGQILIQIHAGFLHLVVNESHSGMLMTILKALSLLVSAAPFNRLPEDLLPKIISSVGNKAKELFASPLDQSNIVAIAVSCLGATLSTTPPSPQVEAMLAAELSSGFVAADDKQTLISKLFLFLEPAAHPSIRFEAFQALRAAIHNYPSIMPACWNQVSSIVLRVIESSSVNDPQTLSALICKGSSEQNMRPTDDKVILSAVKVLDEFLRVVSGFKGTDDLLDDGLLNPSILSVLPRPIRSLSGQSTHRLKGREACDTVFGKGSGTSQWIEALERHLPPALVHVAPMVRAAALTCFAGSTSLVFFALPDGKQTFIISSIMNAASKDEIPSVRSAACRAIGVIASFPQISMSNLLGELVNVIVSNTYDTSVSVRITATWALANICDSLRHNAATLNSEKCPTIDSSPITLLAECALRLSKDGDKIKANAVRALGNLARFVQFGANPIDSLSGSYKLSLMYDFKSETKKEVRPSIILPSLERMVQAFVSCVTTGNVKVQWNVCHALGNLFLNESIKLQNMSWAPSVYSILLLLLRDSSNYKIRIHAASALAVPSTREDYGDSFADLVQTLVHTLETLDCDQGIAPSSFKYRKGLEEQLTSTTLHIFGLALPEDYQNLNDFLNKRANFLEEWLKSTCTKVLRLVAYADYQSSETSKDVSREKDRELDVMGFIVCDGKKSQECHPPDICNDVESNASVKEVTHKKSIILRAMQALIEMYRYGNHLQIVSKLVNLVSQIS